MANVKVFVTVLLILIVFGVAGLAAYIYISLLPISDDVITQVKNVEESVQKRLLPQPITQYKEPEEPKHGYQAGPVVKIRNESYFVSGNDREVLCDKIDTEERRVEEDRVQLGYINSTMRYEYYPTLTSKGYTIGDFTVTTDSVITVPQWTSSGGASEDTKNDWRRNRGERKRIETTCGRNSAVS